MPGDGNLAETVQLLDNVAGQGAPNQRVLAQRLGVSVGLVNALMRRAVRKGLVKIRQAPAHRYAYYLTPKGFAEKSRLVAEYLDNSLTFFRAARQDYGDLFARCAASGRRRIVLCGAGELAEIATLAAAGIEVTLAAVLDRETNQVSVAGLPVIRGVAALRPDDVVVICDGRDPQRAYDRMVAAISSERVIAPAFLLISPAPVAVTGAVS